MQKVDLEVKRSKNTAEGTSRRPEETSQAADVVEVLNPVSVSGPITSRLPSSTSGQNLPGQEMSSIHPTQGPIAGASQEHTTDSGYSQPHQPSPTHQTNAMNVDLPPPPSPPTQGEHVTISSGDGGSHHGRTDNPWGVSGATSGLRIHPLLPMIPIGSTSS